MLEPPEQSHWVSYSTFEGPPDPLNGNECMVSVVLDGDAHASFSGVRLVVVYRESTSLRDVTLTECCETKRLGLTKERPQGLIPTHGGRLLLTRRRRQRGATHVAQHNSLTTPIYTVVFELVRLQSANCCTLRPCPTDLSDDTLRVAYSRYWPSSPTQRSLVVFLECSHNFVEPENIMCRCCCDIKLPGYSVRVVPTKRTRPAFRGATLPPHIVRSIVNHAVNRWARGWRQSLLSYALVQKSWLHVLDLYFEGFGTQDVGNIGNPKTIARSLEKKPERGQLITAFCDADFTRWNMESSSSTLPKEYEDALSTILKLATEIEHIEVAKARLHNLEDALAPLRKVECFTLAYSSPSDMERVTIKDVQGMAKNWTQLKKLVMHEWSPSTEPPTSTLPCRLEELQLIEGRLSQAELFSFIEPCRFSLKTLKIQQVVDLVNADLLKLLLAVSDTLTELVITRSTITFTDPDEQDAFEAALPSLHRLTSAMVQGDKITCSTLAITRTSSPPTPVPASASAPSLALSLSKPLPSSCSSLSSSLHPTTSAPTSPTTRLKAIRIHKASDCVLDGLAEAMETCPWDAVDLHFLSGVLSSRQGKVLVAQAEEVALRRGVKLRMHKYPFWA